MIISGADIVADRTSSMAVKLIKEVADCEHTNLANSLNSLKNICGPFSILAWKLRFMQTCYMMLILLLNRTFSLVLRDPL